MSELETQANSTRHFVNLSLLGILITTWSLWSYSRSEVKIMPLNLNGLRDLEVSLVARKHLDFSPPVILFVDSNGIPSRASNPMRSFSEFGFATVNMHVRFEQKERIEEWLNELHIALSEYAWIDLKKSVWIIPPTLLDNVFKALKKSAIQDPKLLIVMKSSKSSISPDNFTLGANRFYGSTELLFVGNEKEASEAATVLGEVFDEVNLLNVEGFSNSVLEQSTLFRGIAEYAANKLETTGFYSLNMISSNWHFWLPFSALAGILIFLRSSIFIKRNESSNIRTISFIAIFLVLALGNIWLFCAPSSKWTRSLAARYFINPSQVDAFTLLATEAQQNQASVKEIVETLELAYGNRTRFYTSLNEDDFKNYMLSSKIGDKVYPNWWYSTLWKRCHSYIQRENNSLIAAKILVNFLRERLTITQYADELGDRMSVWYSGKIRKSDFNILYIATLRSIGIAARIRESGYPELLHKGDWIKAPDPLFPEIEDRIIPLVSRI